MIGDSFYLNEDQWAAVAVHLPTNQRGPKRIDDRIVISGIIYVLQSGCAWRACPPEYGPYMTIFNRFIRWKRRGVWQRIVDALAKDQPMLVAAITDDDTNERTPGRKPQLKRSRRTDMTSRAAAKVKSLLRRSTHEAGQIACGQRRRFRTRDHAIAAAQVEALIRSNKGKPKKEWIASLVEWHVLAIAAAKSRA